MQTKRRWRAVLCALGLATAVASAEVANALTLADLDGGGSFMTASGLTFSNFDATVTGGLLPDLTQYPVQPQADGFLLSGPLLVAGGGVGTLLLSYQVTAAASIQVVGASLSAAGLTIGAGAFAMVGESVLGPASEFLGSLQAYDIEGDGSVPSDSINFGPVSKLSVAKNAVLGGGAFAAVSSPIGQHFQVVPEPVSMLLLVTGLAGLAWWPPRRTLVH